MNMCIIFTDKLTKIVAHYKNLRDMIFELNTSLDMNAGMKFELVALFNLEEQQHNSRSQEEWRTARHKTNLENFVLRERLADKNGWKHYVYQADECALHGTYVRATRIELCRNDFATTTQLQVTCTRWIPKTYFTFAVLTYS